MKRPSQVAADVRRLTQLPNADCRLSNRPSPGLAATLSHPTLATPEASPRRVGEGLGVRALLRVGSWPQFACKELPNRKSERWLPDMDLNHDKQIQSLLCYRYTIGQSGAADTVTNSIGESSS